MLSGLPQPKDINLSKCVTIISKTSKEGDFPAVDACLSTGKAARGLKERELIFIMLFSLSH